MRLDRYSKGSSHTGRNQKLAIEKERELLQAALLDFVKFFTDHPEIRLEIREPSGGIGVGDDSTLTERFDICVGRTFLEVHHDEFNGEVAREAHNKLLMGAVMVAPDYEEQM
jgi:hypothetical protein